MSKIFYKPLTTSLRADINTSIDKSIEELKTCKSNTLVNMRILGLKNTKRLINTLPDGYLIPMERS